MSTAAAGPRSSDRFDLQRFVDAQAPLLAQVRAELASGLKRSHWMWFFFPQLRSLGRSATALRYGIADLDEACAYAAHPLLGPRLVDCAQLVFNTEGRSAKDILGSPDDLKLNSSMTLFERAAVDEPVFAAVLAKYFAGRSDPRTLALL